MSVYVKHTLRIFASHRKPLDHCIKHPARNLFTHVFAHSVIPIAAILWSEWSWLAELKALAKSMRQTFSRWRLRSPSGKATDLQFSTFLLQIRAVLLK